MALRELTYEFDTSETSRLDPATVLEVRILTLEQELRFERRQHENTRIERDLAKIRNRQFERLASSLADRIDELHAEITKIPMSRDKAV
jgi:hypothetical protein